MISKRDINVAASLEGLSRVRAKPSVDIIQRKNADTSIKESVVDSITNKPRHVVRIDSLSRAKNFWLDVKASYVAVNKKYNLNTWFINS